MKVRVPRKLKIAGHWWEILYERGLGQHHHKYGLVSSDILQIHIDPTIPDSMKSHTLIHELCHIISDQFVSANAFSEECVGQLATGTWTMLVDLGIELDWSDIPTEK